jgi:hypothetical protein
MTTDAKWIPPAVWQNRYLEDNWWDADPPGIDGEDREDTNREPTGRSDAS